MRTGQGFSGPDGPAPFPPPDGPVVRAAGREGGSAERTTGHRPPAGIKDVAREAGVSVGTVSHVLNRPERVSDRTRHHVQQVIARLGYVRSEFARQVRAGRSRIVSVLVLDMGNPFFVEVVRGAERTARDAGMGVMVCNSGQSVQEEADYLALFAEQRVRGALITPADSSGRTLREFRRFGIPFVVVDRVAGNEEGCSVAVDNVAGGALAIRHLTSVGHRRIAFVSGPEHLKQVQDRRSGALAALAAAGLSPEALHELPTDRLDVAAGRDAGARLLGLARRPTAVFCVNDLLALGVLQTLYTAGVRVPDDIAIVGYDDIEFAAAAAVPLTSVRQPAYAIGTIAADLLLRETGEQADEHRHEHVVLQPELVVRQSSTPGV
ncbi:MULTISPECIES: LacI family DNA-binding transcriptional regulator [unclassified Streptomyces]|uniref:LacI family DNA-binding transcriptional regulator n=1 Tax=unclassified Streptomyces TaxID=2593676 RepID=UPI0036E1A0E0